MDIHGRRQSSPLFEGPGSDWQGYQMSIPKTASRNKTVCRQLTCNIKLQVNCRQSINLFCDKMIIDDPYKNSTELHSNK